MSAEEEARRPSLARTARRIGLPRLLFTGLVLLGALLLARTSWQLPLLDIAERALYDMRSFLTAPAASQDPRITLVVYNDETLAATGKRSPVDRALLAKALTALDAMHPKAIGIDILIDQQQPEDAQLIAAFRRMRTPTYLGYATNATNQASIQLWQQQFIERFVGKLAPGNVHKTSIKLEPDPDGVIRRWPATDPRLPPLLAFSLAGRSGGFEAGQRAIRFRLPETPDRPVFTSLPIDLFAIPAAAGAMRGEIAGRYVLIGGDISDVDQFQTPLTIGTAEHRTTIGLEVHATLLAQLLDGRLLPLVPDAGLWLAALLVVLMAAATSVASVRAWLLAPLIAGELLLLLLLPLGLSAAGIDTLGLPAFGWLLAWLIAFTGAGAAARGIDSEQRRFAQSALGKYLPRNVAEQILRDPERLRLSGEKRGIYALFSDLEGFTKLSHAIAPEMVASLLNRYLEMLSEIVLAHGGTIDKFVGDAVVAFWGAPFASPDDADNAVRAALAIAQAGERFRAEAPPGVPPIGRTRVGLHYGEAIVGNFGGEGRIQYTALGDAMNCAARLEGANKYLHSGALVSESVVERSSLDIFRPLGRIVLSGRATPIAVYEPLAGDGDAAADRAQIAALYERFEAGDGAALDDLAACAARHSGDEALATMVQRLKKTGPGGAHVLESK